jgi:cyanate lyase
MELPEITDRLLEAKRKSGLTFAQLGEAIGRSEVWTTAVIYRQAAPSQEEAEGLFAALGLPKDDAAALTQFPVKADLLPTVPTDPLIYRFYEIVQVYGLPLKSIIQEKFGEGIMSAIDFTMSVDREENPNGDRVLIRMSGKFLPYKKW